MPALTAKQWLHTVKQPLINSPTYGQKIAMLMVVLAIHSVLIGLFFFGHHPEKHQAVVPPTIQGVMIVAQMQPTVMPVVKPIVKPSVVPPTKTPTVLPVQAAPSPKVITQPDVPLSESTALQKSEPVVQAVAEPIAPVSTQTPVKEISEEVTPPRSDAAHLSNPAPSYPSMSRRLGEQGRVVLEVYILVNGTVGEIRLKQSSGFKRLDQAAMQAVKKWQYQPAHKGQHAIDFWYVQPLSFSLGS
ncbi:energy transducer TonB [Moraxellaceae bacterium AER2_44_116]|nr:energy transducer TonB [Moraxellaceae bacterium]TQC98331.1 energy transducer TonB [Moraxellaceae bacterium AER2_44_116]